MSAAFCISAVTSWRMCRRRFWQSGSAGRKRTQRHCRRSCARLRAPANFLTTGTTTLPSRNRARRIGVIPELVVRTLGGNLKTAPEDAIRSSDRYIVIGREGAAAPIRSRRRGPMHRSYAGRRRRCPKIYARRRKGFSALISMTLRLAASLSHAAQRCATGLVHFRAPTSMPATSQAIWRHGAQSVSIVRGCPLSADFALHKYFAACAVAGQPAGIGRHAAPGV